MRIESHFHPRLGLIWAFWRGGSRLHRMACKGEMESVWEKLELRCRRGKATFERVATISRDVTIKGRDWGSEPSQPSLLL